MPHSIHASIGMPTICQCVCRPIMNIGMCEATPARISAQPAQNASGWWKASPWLARVLSRVIVFVEGMWEERKPRALHPPLRRQGERKAGCEPLATGPTNALELCEMAGREVDGR